MSAVAECPSCGETEALRGTPVDEDIAITCQACGATWMRGAPRCKTCGGEDIVPRPQAMSRNPRGNQLAFVGWREIPLCRTCDVEVLSTSMSKNQPVREGYVSAFLFGPKDRVPTPIHSPAALPPPRTSDKETGAEARAPKPPSSQTFRRPSGNTPSRRPRPTPSACQPPTVRQGVEAFLASGVRDADSTAMLMLATHLGPSTRLNSLEGAAAAKDISLWFERLYGVEAGRSRDSALRTIVGAIDFWRAQCWVADDPAAGLR
jgi:hypothetical protein